MGIFTFNNLLAAVKMNGLSESFLPPMILNMSITASVIILFVLLARLALKKAPKIFSYALWAVVLFRLLCPVSITTDFSLLGLFDTPAVENTQHTTAVEYIPYDVVHTPNLEVQLPVPPAINDAVNHTLPQEHAALGADPLEGEFAIGSFVWLLGIAAMAIYSAASYIRLCRKLVGSVLLRENIYLADGIGSPFVMGFIRPKIYLPSALSEQEQGYIILHEQHHIRRGDHIIKALAFVALCIHWFNPLVWIAFILSSKDMEMSCDEAVVKKLGEGIRADYSASLLSLATGRRIIAGTPLAFGEGDTKSRIKNMLNWKKPKTWMILVALIVCVVAIAFCATNPRDDVPEEDSMVVWELDQEYPDAVIDIVDDYILQQVEYYNDLGSGDTAIGGEYSILEAKAIGLTKVVATGFADAKQSVELYRLEYRLLPSEPSHVMLAGGMQMDGDWITEWGSAGQPYFALLCDWSSGEEVWTKIGVTNTDVIDHEYSTTEMLAQYHDKYDAAAMELYKEYLNEEGQGSYGAAEGVSYYLELAAGETFQDMSLEKQVSLLVEYEDLLDDYTLIARETEDGKTAYIVGQYNGNPIESPLYGMYSIDMYTGEEEYFRFLYQEEEAETVEAVVAANQTEFPPSTGYRIEDSRIIWTDNSGCVLIQPKTNELLLDVPWNRYFYTPNGQEYIADAVSRGIDVCGRTDTYLYVYRISERFGEIAERIALTEAEAQAILAEERVNIADGLGFSASLHIDDQTTYYNEREGIPWTVLTMAVEKCDYRFGEPDDITDTIREARLDCDWLDTTLYADEADLPRLREILKNAEHGYVGACGYGAKLILTFTGGEKMTIFKGCDGCDTIVFGSYGGYFLGEKENIEFWEMFGLNPDTKTPLGIADQTLSLDDVVTLSRMGYDLTWGDFNQYRYITTGSGLHIRVYEINEMFELWIGGASLDDAPMYICLALADDPDMRIDIRDGGVEAFIARDHSETLLNSAIYDAILDHNLSKKTFGLNNCASFVMLDKAEISGTPVVGSTDHVGMVTVYGLALYQGYALVHDELREEAGSHIPVAITFDVLNGKYSLKEYWTPRDGTYYAPDIREKFPDRIEDEAMNTQKYIAAQKQECYVQAMRNNGIEVSDPDQQSLPAKEQAAAVKAIFTNLRTGWWNGVPLQNCAYESAAFECLDREENRNIVNLYGYGGYFRWDRSETCIEQWYAPTIVTLDTDTQQVLDLWWPGDGAAYEASILKKFPESIASTVAEPDSGRSAAVRAQLMEASKESMVASNSLFAAGTTHEFGVQDLRVEITNVLSVHKTWILAEGIEPHEYVVVSCTPESKITVLDAGMSDPIYAEDGKPHPQWGLLYTGENERTRITDETGTVPVTSDLEGIYNLESSLFVIQLNLVD